LRDAIDLGKRPMEKAHWAGAIDNLGGDYLTWLTRTMGYGGNIASIGLAQSYELNTTVMPFILRAVCLLGINSVDTPRHLREQVWQRIGNDLMPQHLDLIAKRTIEFDELPELTPDRVDFVNSTLAGSECGHSRVKVKKIKDEHRYERIKEGLKKFDLDGLVTEPVFDRAAHVEKLRGRVADLRESFAEIDHRPARDATFCVDRAIALAERAFGKLGTHSEQAAHDHPEDRARSSDLDREPLSLHRLLERLHVPRRHRCFDEDCRHAPLGDEVGQLLDIGGSGLRGGAHPEQAIDLEGVGAAEVRKGVMGGHQHPLLGLEVSHPPAHPAAKRH